MKIIVGFEFTAKPPVIYICSFTYTSTIGFSATTLIQISVKYYPNNNQYHCKEYYKENISMVGYYT